MVKAEHIDFSQAVPVTSAAQKFIIPIATFPDGDPLLHPEGTEFAGQPIRNWDGALVGETGIVFFNEVDRRYQAAAADGNSVVIVNEVTRAKAGAIEEFIRQRGEPIDRLPKSSLKLLLEYLRSELGLIDIYSSTDEFVRSKMVPIGMVGALDCTRPSGWMRRDDRDVCHAVFVKGPAELATEQIMAHGAFIVRQGRDYRMVDALVFARTYVNLDGSHIDLNLDLLGG